MKVKSKAKSAVEDLADVGRFGSLRSHQRQIAEMVRDIVDQHHGKCLTASVVPGGGKTLMAAIHAQQLLDSRAVNYVIVVVPNRRLGTQCVQGFVARNRSISITLRMAIPKEGEEQIEIQTIRARGSVVTYQSLGQAKVVAELLEIMRTKRVLLIFDEVHHLSVGEEFIEETGKGERDAEKKQRRAWYESAKPLYEASRHVLCMSGTMWRTDRKQIPFIEYDDRIASPHVTYSRQTALEEKAITPVNFMFFNGDVAYSYNGKMLESELGRETNKKRARRALSRATSDLGSYAFPLVQRALDHHEHYQSLTGHVSSMVIACQSKEHARAIHKYVKEHAPRRSPVLCISGESDKAYNAFYAGHARIMTTVRKASEGMDVEKVTHVVVLANTRATLFLDQLVARGTRIDRTATCPVPVAQQSCFVFVPDDIMARQYADAMLEEQRNAYKDETENKRAGLRLVRTPGEQSEGYAIMTNVRFGMDGHVFSERDSQLIEDFDANPRFKTNPTLSTLPPREKLAIMYSIVGPEVSP